MGTNYYLFTRSKNLAQRYFATNNSWGVSDEEYEISDEPLLGYYIHLNKLSYGWRPLFQCHKAFSSFVDLELFFKEHQKSLKIFDEYGEEFGWDAYKKIIMNHSGRKPEPMKWVYEEDEFLGKRGRKYFQTIRCTTEEAEIWIPFDHLEYEQSEKLAAIRLNCYDKTIHDSSDFYSHNDKEYRIDWANGDFG